MTPTLDLGSRRAQEARLSQRFAHSWSAIISMVSAVSLGAAIYCLSIGGLPRAGYAAGAVAGVTVLLLGWYRLHLKHLLPLKPATGIHDVLEPAMLGALKNPLTPRLLWEEALRHPTGRFISDRLLLHPEILSSSMSNEPGDTAAVWQQAMTMAAMHPDGEITAGTVAAACLLVSPGSKPFLTSAKLRAEDVTDVAFWLDRQLNYMHQPKPYFGGIGRDWANGFTPILDKFGANISRSVEGSGGAVPGQTHATLLPGIAGSLAQGGNIALVGPEGVGRSTLVEGLAHYLLEGRQHQLQYYQIVSLQASLILSNSGNQLEKVILSLLGEAVAAGNIILFLDDAHLFFGSGVGAFDIGQVLQPILRNRSIHLIASFSPSEWQQLQSKQPALASSLAPITVPEPDTAATMRVIEDDVAALEFRGHVFISYDAVREAYRLSGQYLQEDAYPGKAVRLLEQAIPYADNGLVHAETIQQAIEKSKGVRVAGAQAPEADMLLHLEDRIHERMINQTRAVNVIASALRRGRAGVTNPKRPLGSFLFLGPTGVGKTELARSLAAVYYGDEKQMIRLDMSEYQRPEDVSRLLSTGSTTGESLLQSIRKQPFAVVLLDEIEKAHPNILNLMLQMLDEGQLTDEQGRPASFRSSIIIATSNAGAADITKRVQQGESLENFERPLIDSLIQNGQFKPELMKRFDEIVLFRPLTEEELSQVATIMLAGVNKTLEPQHISVALTPEALKSIVHAGYDPEFGARPMRRVIQKTVENAVAVKILAGKAQAGDTITLDVADVTEHADTPVAPVAGQ